MVVLQLNVEKTQKRWLSASLVENTTAETTYNLALRTEQAHVRAKAAELAAKAASSSLNRIVRQRLWAAGNDTEAQEAVELAKRSEVGVCYG